MTPELSNRKNRTIIVRGKMISIQERLADRCVAVAGCGGLGSNCAVALVRAGVNRLVLADFDTVTLSNLNRQYYFLDQVGQKKVVALRENLLRIDPRAEIEIHDLRLEPASVLRLFAACDVIVEAFDRADQKRMIVETVLENLPEKPLVCGSGLAGWGRSNEIRVERHGNLYLCGDNRREVSENEPPLAPRVGIVASMQANQVLEILLGGAS
jgi:sulfur carrier protein ThiS adenylyltransferase